MRRRKDWHQSADEAPPRKWGSIDYTLAMISLAMGWALLIGYPEPQAQEVRDVVGSQTAPAPIVALPALSPNAIQEDLPPTF